MGKTTSLQESNEIRQWPIIEVHPHDYTQNYPFCRLQLMLETFDTPLNEPTNQNSIKVHKVVKPTNQKTSP